MSATGMETVPRGQDKWKLGFRGMLPIDPFRPMRQSDTDPRARAEQYYAKIQRVEKEHRYLTPDYWQLGKALLELMALGIDPYTLGYERHRLDRAIRIKERFVVPEDCAEIPVDEAAFGKRADPPLENLSGSFPSKPSSEEGDGNGPLDDQTPESLWRHIISSVEWHEGETVLEPFKGDGNCFRNLPSYVVADWCEIREHRDFFPYQVTVDTIITNPPFRSSANGQNLVIPALEKCLAVATKRVLFLVSHKVFAGLTPVRLEAYARQGWGVTRMDVYSVKKWSGRYYLLVFERGMPSIIGYNTTNWAD
jgi:hypothetical protein